MKEPIESPSIKSSRFLYTNPQPLGTIQLPMSPNLLETDARIRVTQLKELSIRMGGFGAATLIAAFSINAWIQADHPLGLIGGTAGAICIWWSWQVGCHSRQLACDLDRYLSLDEDARRDAEHGLQRGVGKSAWKILLAK